VVAVVVVRRRRDRREGAEGEERGDLFICMVSE